LLARNAILTRHTAEGPNEILEILFLGVNWKDFPKDASFRESEITGGFDKASVR
jgi:hypothetical protein